MEKIITLNFHTALILSKACAQKIFNSQTFFCSLPSFSSFLLPLRPNLDVFATSSYQHLYKLLFLIPSSTSFVNMLSIPERSTRALILFFFASSLKFLTWFKIETLAPPIWQKKDWLMIKNPITWHREIYLSLEWYVKKI